MQKIEMKKEDRERLLGILPFSNDTTEDYIPEKLFESIPDCYKPIFILRPFKSDEKNEYKKAISKIHSLDHKTLLKNSQKLSNELARIICLVIIDIKNLINIGTMEVDNVPKKDDHITVKFFENLPELLKADLQARVVAISGLSKYETMAL